MNPRGADGDELLRVHRGGAYGYGAQYCRVSQRNFSGTRYKSSALGLRIARSSLREGEGIPPHGESATMALFTGRTLQVTGLFLIPYYPPDAVLSFQTLPGVMHRIEMSSLLPPVSWVATGARVEGDGCARTILLEDMAVENRKFFRVVAE